MATVDRVYLLGGQPRHRLRFRKPVATLRKRTDIHQAMTAATKESSVWIATSVEWTDELLREAMSTHRKHRLGRLLMLFPPRPASLPALEEIFRPVAWGTKEFRVLPSEELTEVLLADNRHDLFVAGFVDAESHSLILYRGDFERLMVPLTIFKKLGGGAKADAKRLSLTDFGQTVRLGDYEAASDAILYEADPDYRRRVNAERNDQEKSLGASLRRLRVLKGLRQSDFGSIPAKTIARIERGEVANPQKETLRKIAEHIGVGADEIEEY